MADTLQIAQTIAQQIGHRAFVMMGTKTKVGDERSLAFDIHGCPIFTKIRIVLDHDDTYTVEFFKFRNHQILRHRTISGVYADGLNQAIEHNTGLCLSL